MFVVAHLCNVRRLSQRDRQRELRQRDFDNRNNVHGPISIAVYAECNKIRRIILAFRCFAGYFFVT